MYSSPGKLKLQIQLILLLHGIVYGAGGEGHVRQRWILGAGRRHTGTVGDKHIAAGV
jgi:hypothetical protein